MDLFLFDKYNLDINESDVEVIEKALQEKKNQSNWEKNLKAKNDKIRQKAIDAQKSWESDREILLDTDKRKDFLAKYKSTVKEIVQFINNKKDGSELEQLYENAAKLYDLSAEDVKKLYESYDNNLNNNQLYDDILFKISADNNAYQSSVFSAMSEEAHGKFSDLGINTASLYDTLDFSNNTTESELSERLKYICDQAYSLYNSKIIDAGVRQAFMDFFSVESKHENAVLDLIKHEDFKKLSPSDFIVFKYARKTVVLLTDVDSIKKSSFSDVDAADVPKLIDALNEIFTLDIEPIEAQKTKEPEENREQPQSSYNENQSSGNTYENTNTSYEDNHSSDRGENTQQLQSFSLSDLIGPVLIVLAIIIAISGISHLFKTFNIKKYINEDSIVLEGIEGEGKLTFNPDSFLDLKSIYDKYVFSGGTEYEDFKKLFEIETSGKTENLSNGDKYKITIKWDKKKLKKVMKKRIRGSSKYVYEYEVNTLDDVPTINPFTFITFKFGGTNGNVTAKIGSDKSHATQYGYTLKLTKGNETGSSEEDVLEIYKGNEYIDGYNIQYQKPAMFTDSIDKNEGDTFDVTLVSMTNSNQIKVITEGSYTISKLDEIASSKGSISEKAIERVKQKGAELTQGEYLSTYFIESEKKLFCVFLNKEYSQLEVAKIEEPGIDSNGNIQQYSIDSIEIETINIEDVNNYDLEKEIKNYYSINSSVAECKID